MSRKCIFYVLVLLAGYAGGATADSTINATHRWSWSSGAGWMNWRTDSTNGVVVGEYFLSGWIYSSTCGWIHTGDGSPTNGVNYTNQDAVDYGVNHDGVGNLSGYAWSETSGWINFGWTNTEAANAPRINLQTGNMSGYAWGGALGWIGLSNMSARVQTDAFDPGPLASNGLPVAWQILMTGGTNILTGEDYDFDELFDYDEYIAGTHPTNPASCLRAGGFEQTESGNFKLGWQMSGGRWYQVETNAVLTNANGWADVFPEWINSGTGGWYETEMALAANVTSLFYRIKVAMPLSQ